MRGRSPTCYSPVRHSSTPASRGLSVRLACVKHAASVHPEPGSNSPQKICQRFQAREKPVLPTNNINNQHTTTRGGVTRYPKLLPTNVSTKLTPLPQPLTGHSKEAAINARLSLPAPATPTRSARRPAFKDEDSVTGRSPSPGTTTTPQPSRPGREGRHNRHDHPPHQKGTARGTKQKYIGTLLSSHTTHAHTSCGTDRADRVR